VLRSGRLVELVRDERGRAGGFFLMADRSDDLAAALSETFETLGTTEAAVSDRFDLYPRSSRCRRKRTPSSVPEG
jgi:hypothetical protein